MGTRKGFLEYDMFKLVVLLFLFILLVYFVVGFFPVNIRVFLTENERSTTDPLTSETENAQMPEPIVLPDFPKTKRGLVLNEDWNGLIDENGTLIFALSDNGEQWEPIVDDLLKLSLPEGFSTRRDESGIWFIIAADGSALYFFNEEDAIWKIQEKLAPAGLSSAVTEEQGFTCPLANPVRIGGEGEQVRVVNAVIPLRETPDAVSQNFIVELDQGTILEVMGGPVCQPFLSGANVWWKVRLQNGIEGYAAEGSAISDTYYLEAVQ
jgi:hypothetical protein